MRIFTPVAIISALMLLVAQKADAQFKSTQEPNYIEVTANAYTEVSPDEFYLQITIDESLTGNKSSLEKKERELFSALKELGIDLEKNLQVQDITSSLKNYIFSTAKILNSKSYILKLNSADLIMPVFNAAEKIKISQVVITKTGVSNPDKIKQEVLAKAAEKAKNNADVLAAALGVKVGKPLYIQNYDNAINPFRSMAKGEMKLRSAAVSVSADESAPDLEFEKIRFDQQVMVRFVIE